MNLTKLTVVFSFLFSTFVYAGLSIDGDQRVYPERRAEYTAIFTTEDGEEIDVTEQTTFRFTESARETGIGEFIFSLPIFIRDQYVPVRVNATYVDSDGLAHLASFRSELDLTPDYIRLEGGSFRTVPSGGSLNLRAYGYYFGRRVDLSSTGRWSAWYGNCFNGFYTAPRLTRRNSQLRDIIEFRFGIKSARESVTVVRR